MLIGRDDISNDVITFGVCFHMFFNVCLRSRWFPFCADILAKISPLSRREATRELYGEFKFPKM